MAAIVLLSGGSGTRLWPLSNEARSKQFLKVLRDGEGKPQSMVQRVVSQIRKVEPDIAIVVATSASQVASIESQLDGEFSIVVEPNRRDTAPAIMLAGTYLDSVRGLPADEPIIVMPIDSFVEDSYFELIDKLSNAVRRGGSDIVLVGVEPTYPSEKYGYIIPSCGQSGETRAVESFKEKPTEREAAQLIARGALWNCGAFAFELGYIRTLATQYSDAATYDEMVAHYDALPHTSFDYEVVEQADSVSVVAYGGPWKDLGTWNTLTEEMSDPQAGRVISDDVAGTHIVNELNIPLVALGIQDAVIVATPDGILISDKAASAHMKPFVEQAAEDRAMYETRNWGEYRVLDHAIYGSGKKSLTKHLLVSSGCQISYQRHSLREEIWTVVDGSGELVINGAVRFITSGESVSIPKGTCHAIRALDDLHIIEVQLGSMLTEDDIERFGFYWESNKA